MEIRTANKDDIGGLPLLYSDAVYINILNAVA